MRNFFENDMATVAQVKEAGFFYCSTWDPLWNNVLPSSQRERRVSRLNRTGNNTTGWARRLTALLITACLVMAMALPVYADADLLPDVPDEVELLEGEPETASEKDTIEQLPDANAPPEQNAATPVPDAATPEPEQSAGPEQPAPTETPEPTAEPTPTPEPAATATATPVPTVTPTATPEPTEQPQKMYAARSVDNVQAVSEGVPETYTLYFAVPDKWSDCTVVRIYAVGEQNPDKAYYLDMQEADKTKDGRKIYSVVLNEANHYPYGGLNGLEFRGYKSKGEAFENGKPADTEYKIVIAEVDQNLGKTWMTFNSGDHYIGGDYYDGENGDGWHPEKWETYTVGHKHFAGKEMAFENKTGETLTNVKAWFYEPNDEGTLELVGGPISLNSVGLDSGIASGATVTFDIPEGFCSFVRFTAGDNDTEEISEYYNFYNEEVTGVNQKRFQYSEGQCYCYMYNGNDDATWGCPGATRIYYDATFSKMATGDTGDFSIPKASNSETIYYRIKGKEESKSGTLTKDGTNENLYYIDIPQGYSSIIFSGDAINGDEETKGNGVSTAWLTIPTDGNNCFYADTNDDAVYTNGQRGGYWAPKGTLRDAETWKEPKTKVVDIASATFTEDPDTKYVTSTLYDYYTDYELNGNNRDKYGTSTGASHRNWVTFREFDQALSDYYKTADAQYPLYTGHFQPSYFSGNYQFQEISAALNLWGFNSDFKSENRFMAINNSTINENGNGEFYDYAYQGLVESKTSTGDATGKPLLKDTKVAEPHFDEAFLSGTNTKNAKLGNVYNNVAFPFTKKQIFGEDQGVDYWYFDSKDTTLYLKQDSEQNSDSKYFLQKSTDNRDRSVNVNASSTPQGQYGYFPFNETATSGVASTYNYGFGTKLQMDFTLTDDGMVETKKKDSNGNPISTNIKFFFSGDDDVWVFIDGQLVLDVGGAHGKVSGLLEFGETKDGKKNSVTAYVSQVKKGGTSENDQDGKNGNTAVKNVTYNGDVINFYAQNTNLEPLDKGKKHTLTMYYMERGMWESNMAVAFNFPDNNELQVQKEVDLTNVTDTDFKNCFKNQKIFNFTIQNQATHYGPKEAAKPDTGDIRSQVVDLTENGGNTFEPATEPTESNKGDYIFELATNPEQGSGQDTKKVLHWYARYPDTEPVSYWRKQRYGILKLKDPINIKDNMRFLTFQVYVNSEDGGELSLNNLYLELLDEKNVQKGSLGTTGINGATYGSVELVTDQWVTVKLDLHKMKEQDGFSGNVKTIRVGDNYSRHIYFRNFTFIPKAVPTEMTGFTTDQEKIPDYGSAKTGQLKNAENAQYTSNMDTDTQLVDENGRFVLEDGEIVTFSDQFRRGSYISLKEELNENLYDTTWTVCENGQVVTSTNPDDTSNVKTVTFGKNRSLEKQSDPPKGPDDGRTEKKGTEEEQQGNQYDGTKPSADTIVFRSYKDPDETSSTLTKLKVKYVNKVKTGGLKIQKKAAEGETLTGTYEFKVTFNDVGGEGLEEKPIEKTVTINMSEGDTGTITGIPVGTRYTIEEVKTSDDSKLQSVTVPQGQSAHVINNNTMVEGEIVKSKDPNDPNNLEITAIFTNTQRTLINIEFDKLWKDADGNSNLSTANQPKEIYIQLQRRLASETNWTPVNYPADSTKNYVTITHRDKGWTSTFSGLDQYPIGGSADNNYIYRIVEGTVDDEGNFAEVKPNETITIKGNTYVVTAEAKAEISEGNSTKVTQATATDGTITGDSGTIVLTNKLQNPKFVLDIIKKDAEKDKDGNDVFLKDVEFKLEKLKAETTTEGEPQVDKDYQFDSEHTGSITAITNDRGEITDVFKDLKPGTYRLTETKAHKGYNLLAQPIVIKFTQDGECYIDGQKVTDNTKFVQSNNTYTMHLTVLNRKTPELPHTGADAPSLWLLIGMPLAVAGLLIFTFRYNRKGGRRH